jgi:hypothetical protein
MVMVGEIRLALYWTRLEMYQDPARVVSKVRLGSYNGIVICFFRDSTFVLFFNFDSYSYRRPTLIRIRIGD